MRQLWQQISPLTTCGLILFLSLAPVSSRLDFRKSGGPIKQILIINKSYEFQCTATGTPSELAGVTIRWKGPDDKRIPGNDKYGSIRVENRTGNVRSILKVSKLPTDYPSSGKLLYYVCELQPDQLNFPVYILKEKAVPKIHPIQLNQTKFKETVLLKCDASYENGNFATAHKFSVILQWMKGGKILANKVFKYETGKNTSTLEHSLTVNSFRDGGDYVCQLLLMLESEADNITSSKTVELQILPYLNGPIEKEVKDTAGSDVELHCDVIGYPITYQWLDEKKCAISFEKSCSDSRIKQKDNILYITDIDYKDRKKYTCVGRSGNNTLEQIIILRVQDPLAALWPFIGILIEAVLVAAIILASEYYKKHSQSKKDRLSAKKREATELATTSST
ncbi:uncharacterized protein LOC114529340 isoform X2 [Dendronephthya gigantea]|uniref:uncharacterized protein LOC114529340 isoform X2 n=1 Tax=Dendronephthya gigantea TaxID=151771 RepID=UPI0010697295|nr:uncharacterized protein LOC114529340 isoform X2 [Dendronephthya gigantea]